MGDSRRFDLFADLIARQFPQMRSAPVADVAGGKGYLQAALYQRGYSGVVTHDIRRKFPRHRKNYKHGRFDHRNAARGYSLVVGMHPDEATDEIVCYAAKHRVPFVVCPCCVLPSATKLQDIGYDGWIRHLVRVAQSGRLRTDLLTLPMNGRAHVIVGRPE